MIRAKGLERSVLVTDAIAAAGCPPGRYRLGDLEVELSDAGRVAVPGSITLAGSALTMDRAVALTARFTGEPLERVLPLASTQAAAVVGLSPVGALTLDWDPHTQALAIRHVDG
jgi:N-acetylglucosamine-6-phosphate deacetylase